MDPEPEVLFVHNPSARRGRAAAREVRSHLGRRGTARCRWITLGELPLLAPGPGLGRAVAVGGDGTVSLVAEWLLRGRIGADLSPDGAALSARAPGPVLGIVPAGTGNNLANRLGIPADPRSAAAIAVSGDAVRWIDAIRCAPAEGGPRGARSIVQSAQLGFPADVEGRFSRLRQGRLFRALAFPLGNSIYRALGLVDLIRIRLREGRAGAPRLRLRATLPGEDIEAEVIAIFIGNDSMLGGGFRPCPLAEVDDGLMDLCWVRAGTRDSYLGLFRDVARGRHLGRTPAVEYRRTAGPVELRLGAPAPLLLDGDIRASEASYRLDLIAAALPIAVAGR